MVFTGRKRSLVPGQQSWNQAPGTHEERATCSPYRACGPFCSCSSPPGIGSRSRSCRPWCCSCWRSLNPSAWPCSHPRAEAGTSAEKDGGARAGPLRSSCRLNISACVWSINAAIWPFCQHCDKCINPSRENPMRIYLTRHRKGIPFQPNGEHVHTRDCRGCFSPTPLSLLLSPLRFHGGAHTSLQEWNSISCSEQRWCWKLQVTINAFVVGPCADI